MLTGKYLKYSPEITLEIFTLVWGKLESLFPAKIYDWIEDWSFESFKKHGYISIWGNNNKYAFGINNNPGIDNKIETTVQEILGYDPFIKEEFVLPEKWFIKITDENKSVLNKWKSKQIYSSDLYKTNFQVVEFNGNGTQYSGYTEITFEQFKKYVLKEPIEEPKVESKEVIPEYVECIEGAYGLIVGCIYKIDEKGFIIGGIGETHYSTVFVKPSTKEAYDLQQLSKSIDKWSVGTFVVFLENVNHVEKGYIDIVNDNFDGRCTHLEKYGSLDIRREEDNEVKLFATKSEAEEFAKTLVESVGDEYTLDMHEEMKQPLKQAVHCTTQEEWDFVKNKINRDNEWEEDYPCQILVGKSNWKGGVQFCINEGLQILSFQEWCDLNGYKMETNIDLTGRYLKALVDGPQSTIFKKGDIVEILRKESKNTYSVGESLAKSWTYTTNNSTANQWELLPEDYKMEKEVKFEVEKYYYFESYDGKNPNIVRCDEIILNSLFKSNNWIMLNNHIKNPSFGSWNFSDIHNSKELSIEEVQQYLPEGHPDKLPLKKEKMILNENLIGKLVSLTYYHKFYTEVLVTKEYNKIYLLNNNYPNNNEHSDKSVYKYSIKFNSFDIANRICSNIKLIEKFSDKQSDSNQEFKVGDFVVVISNERCFDKGCNSESFYKVGLISKIDKLYNEFKGKSQWIHLEGEVGGNGITDNQVRLATSIEIKQYLNSIEQILVNSTDTKLIEDDFKLDYLPE